MKPRQILTAVVMLLAFMGTPQRRREDRRFRKS